MNMPHARLALSGTTALSAHQDWDGGRDNVGVDWQTAQLALMGGENWPCMKKNGSASHTQSFAHGWHLCARLCIWLSQQPHPLSHILVQLLGTIPTAAQRHAGTH